MYMSVLIDFPTILHYYRKDRNILKLISWCCNQFIRMEFHLNHLNLCFSRFPGSLELPQSA